MRNHRVRLFAPRTRTARSVLFTVVSSLLLTLMPAIPYAVAEEGKAEPEFIVRAAPDVRVKDHIRPPQGHKPVNPQRHLKPLPSFRNPDSVVAGLTEARGLRTTTRRYFKEEDGSVHTMQAFFEPEHYVGADGRVHEIDNSLVATDGGYRNAANAYSAFFPGVLSHRQAASFDYEGVKLRFYQESAAASRGTVSEDSVLYRNVFPHADVRYIATSYGLVEHVILKDAKAENAYTYRIESQGARLEQQDDGGIAVSTAEGRWVAQIPPGLVTDAASASTTAQFELTAQGDEYTLSVTVDPAWLADVDRAFPVTVDPDVVVVADPSRTLDPCTRPPDPGKNSQGEEITEVDTDHCFYRDNPWVDVHVESQMTASQQFLRAELLKVGTATSGNIGRAYFDYPFLQAEPRADLIYDATFAIQRNCQELWNGT